ncbi:MAG: hypothetical protein ACKO5A_06800 [Actinomycetota bacterium]
MDFLPSRWRRAAFDAVGQLADGVDDWWIGRHDAGPIGPAPSAGVPATLWAAAKTGAALAGLPFTVTVGGAAAVRAQRTALRRIDAFPDQLRAIAEGRTGPLPVRRAHRLPATGRYVLTSDLHRCVPGRIDWPARQGTKDLYRQVVAAYAEDGWSLVENGDVEDFWMVGGSAWGATYDLGRLAAGLAGPLADRSRRELLGDHVDRIVGNNRPLYDLLAELSVAGRYHRTLGNHDDVLADPHLVERLGFHLPGVEVPDAIVLADLAAEAVAGASLDTVAAVVMHGHLTDAWNGPGLATLGRAATWISTGLDDLPTGGALSGLPGEVATDTLLGGRGENRLITLDARYGGNRRFDSLDEERLFARLGDVPQTVWPWLIFGHTHFPMLRPLDADGHPVRYANSGCGVLPGAFTALEWDGSEPEPLRLVVHHLRHGRPTRTELVPDGDVLTVA